jgi:hypothetical protein
MTTRGRFTQFAALQVLDLLSTWLFLGRGVEEGNPLLREMWQAARGSAAAMAAPKIVAIGLAWYAWRTGRTRLQGRVNLVYAACVAWNVIAALSR